MTLVALLAWVGCVGVGLLLGNLLLNLAVYRRPVSRSEFDGEKVSVLIPARNEAGRIAPLLHSLARQNHPNFEVIVLDDHSTDGTRERVEREAAACGLTARLQIAGGAPLPEGWTGKGWACHQLAGLASGAWLLFTDADTEHEPDALSAAMGLAQVTGAGLLSAWPQQITRTWAEILVVPLIPFLILGFLPMWQLWLAQRSPWFAALLPKSLLQALGAANGQFMLFRRETYGACGGHAAVCGHLVEDVALGRRVAGLAREGHRLVNCDGSRIVRCRMYTSFTEVWEGFTKNLRAGFDQASGIFVASLVFQLVVCVLPFALLGAAESRWPAGLAVAGLVGMRSLLAWRLRTAWASVWLHPVGYLLALAIALNSWRRTARDGVTWKGRIYGQKN